MKSSVVLALLLAVATTASADDRAAVSQLTERFYRALSAGDPGQAFALWSPTAPDLTTTRRRVTARVNAYCIELPVLEVTNAAVTGDHAEVMVDAVLVETSPMPGARPRIMPQHAAFSAERADGDWRITRWQLVEDALVDGIALAPTPAERLQILDSHPELQNATLIRLLASRALQLVNQQRYPDSEILVGIARGLAEESHDDGGLSLALGLESIFLRRQRAHNVAKSIELSRKSLALAERSGEPDVIARACQRLGRALQADAPLESRHFFERVVAMRPYLEDPSLVALAATQVAVYFDDRGDYRSALHNLDVGMAVAKDDPNLLALYGVESVLGGVYGSEHDYELAIPHLTRAVELARQAKFSDGYNISMQELASAYAATGNPAEFLRLSNQVIENMAGNTNLPGSFLADVYASRGGFYLGRGDLANAEAELTKGINAGRASAQPTVVTPLLGALAEVHLQRKEYEQAIKTAEEAIAKSAEGVQYEHFSPLVTAARAERALGRCQRAYDSLREAIRMTEEQRDVVAGTERQQSLFFETHVEAYTFLVDMLVEDHRYEEALTIAEQAKGRALLDILTRGRQLSEDLLTTEERKTEAGLRSRMAMARKELSAAKGSDRAAQLEPELVRARTDLESFRAALGTKYPRLNAQQKTPAPPSLREIAALLPDERTAFVEYVVSADRVHLFLIRRRAGRAVIEVHTIPIAESTLTKRVRRFVDAISRHDLAYREASKPVSRVLIGSIEPALPSLRAVCLIPDGPLWHLPFEALITRDGKFLTEDVATFYAPSIAIYREMASRKTGSTHRSFLGFANPRISGEPSLPPLPDAEREVRTIARLFDSPAVFHGAGALESRVKSDAPRYDVIHFATHSVLDDRNPMYSRLLLTPSVTGNDDGSLETWELMQLDLHASLVVLSACNTARGDVHEGEGLIGMSWALFVAGCPSTIAVEWPVASANTADFMIEFYRDWLLRPRHLLPKAESLRQARLRILRSPAHRHPFYWAGFVLIGSGR